MTPRRSNWYAQIAVAVLIVVLVVLCGFLVRQYRIAVRQGIVSSERIRFAEFASHHPLGAADAGLIEPWMTFDYVSVSFKVPALYLMTALGISSSTAGYPNLTLGRYARTIATSSDGFTQAVRGAVESYLVPKGR
ncbi:MAG: hypothetical protein ABSF56_00620 [Minisyncoccia bacterium]|jgi:hypothetical protein